jgi:hypothetical protein
LAAYLIIPSTLSFTGQADDAGQRGARQNSPKEQVERIGLAGTIRGSRCRKREVVKNKLMKRKRDCEYQQLPKTCGWVQSKEGRRYGGEQAEGPPEKKTVDWYNPSRAKPLNHFFFIRLHPLDRQVEKIWAGLHQASVATFRM